MNSKHELQYSREEVVNSIWTTIIDRNLRIGINPSSPNPMERVFYSLGGEASVIPNKDVQKELNNAKEIVIYENKSSRIIYKQGISPETTDSSLLI